MEETPQVIQYPKSQTVLESIRGGVSYIFGSLFKPDLPTVQKVDLHKYSGVWYQLASMPFRPSNDLVNITATYSLNPDNTIKVINQGNIRIPNGPVKKIEGKARIVDSVTNAKLKVQFVWPFEGDYWIIGLDDNYQWAIVGEASRNYGWILSRTPQVDDQLYQKLVNQMITAGYDGNNIIKAVQVYNNNNQ